MPKPNKGEKQSDFISRCIPIVINEGTTNDSKQAAAICYSIWRRSKGKKEKAKFDEAVSILNSLNENIDKILEDLNKKEGE